MRKAKRVVFRGWPESKSGEQRPARVLDYLDYCCWLSAYL